MDNKTLDNLLNNLSFDEIQVNPVIADQTIKKIVGREKKRHILMISSFFLLTLLMCFTLYAISQLKIEFDELRYIWSFLTICAYSAVVVSILYYFKLVDYLRQTFTVQIH